MKGYYFIHAHEAGYEKPPLQPQDNRRWETVVFAGKDPKEVIDNLFGEGRLIDGRRPTWSDVERSCYELARAIVWLE